MNKIYGFASKDGAKAFKDEHGGRILWEEWSNKYGKFTDRGNEYIKLIREHGLNDFLNRYIVVLEDDD